MRQDFYVLLGLVDNELRILEVLEDLPKDADDWRYWKDLHPTLTSFYQLAVRSHVAVEEGPLPIPSEPRGEPTEQDYENCAENIDRLISDIAVNHPVSRRCDDVDKDLQVLRQSHDIIRRYWAKK